MDGVFYKGWKRMVSIGLKCHDASRSVIFSVLGHRSVNADYSRTSYQNSNGTTELLDKDKKLSYGILQMNVMP